MGVLVIEKYKFDLSNPNIRDAAITIS